MFIENDGTKMFVCMMFEALIRAAQCVTHVNTQGAAVDLVLSFTQAYFKSSEFIFITPQQISTEQKFSK
jgi:hypothetical protein